MCLGPGVPSFQEQHKTFLYPLTFLSICAKLEAFRDFLPPNIRMRLGFFGVWISHVLIMKIPNDVVLYDVYTE